jgi:hypothetical protein
MERNALEVFGNGFPDVVTREQMSSTRRTAPHRGAQDHRCRGACLQPCGFPQLLCDDLNAIGVADVDMLKTDADGRAIEKWGLLQIEGDPKNSAPFMGPNVPHTNRNGMFEEKT